MRGAANLNCLFGDHGRRGVSISLSQGFPMPAPGLSLKEQSS